MKKESYTAWYKTIELQLAILQLPNADHHLARLWFIEGRSPEDIVRLMVESYSDVLTVTQAEYEQEKLGTEV
ncbi:MAG: hypothetical protein JNL32_03565 [Candidatus Kapabacteria bacterium]|nr:hypothetical protein [Candidatus Kapabacteria bacterium]